MRWQKIKKTIYDYGGLISNSAASAGSIFWSLLYQIISVPILVGNWGAHDFGIWLMVSTIPIYIALSDLGISSAATTLMTIQYAQHKFEEFTETFNNSLLTVASLSTAIFLLLWALTRLPLLNTNFQSIVKYSDVILLLSLYAGLAMLSRVYLAIFRSTNRYAFGTSIYDFLQFLEGLGVIFTCYLGGDLTSAAIAITGGRAILLTTFIVLQRHLVPLANIDRNTISASNIQKIFKPAFGALAIPSALAINLQGITLVTGAILGPAIATSVTLSRTASRIALQITGIINRATIPEFSAAYAKKDAKYIKRLLLLNGTTVLGVLLPGSLLLATFGVQLINKWSNGTVIPSHTLLILISIAMILHGFWYFSANLLLAINKHTPIAGSLFIFTLAGVPTCSILAYVYGEVGVGISLLLIEISIAVRLAWEWKKILKELDINIKN